MEFKKYKLGDVAEILNGATPSTLHEEYYGGDIPWFTPKDLSDQGSKYVEFGERSLTREGVESCSVSRIPPNNILMSSRAPIGLLAINKYACYTNQGFKNIIPNSSMIDVEYLYYYLKYKVREIESLGGGTTFKEVSKKTLERYTISLPPLAEQKKIAGALALIDRKIELCEAQNRTLEKLARQIYNYWFVQFDFPNADGKPYKSSGGKMVYNEELKREIPDDWEVAVLENFILKNNTGDWGVDKATSKKNLKVSCVRGADISTLVGMPIRYIDSESREKLLSEWDIVIEISGGSPTQSTGRTALITAGCLARNNNCITCSNFCHAVRLRDEKKSPYFFYTLDLLYKNGVMFGYEGKTSGLKNLMIDSLLMIPWTNPPKNLSDSFFEIIKTYSKEIDSNIAQIQSLTFLRERLLPLLMNGQVEVRD